MLTVVKLSSDLQCFEQLHEVRAVQAQGLGGIGAVTLAVGESADNEFAPVAVDGVVKGY